MLFKRKGRYYVIYGSCCCACREGSGAVRKTLTLPFWRAIFIPKNDRFTKTGSGQAQEKLRNIGVF